MDDPIWITKELALAIHSRNSPSTAGRTEYATAACLNQRPARPRNRFNYEDPTPTLAGLAASYAFGIARTTHLSTAINALPL